MALESVSHEPGWILVGNLLHFFIAQSRKPKLRDDLEVVNGAKSAKQIEKLYPAFCLLLCLKMKCIDQ